VNPVSVIVSTYNQPAWLRKALWGFEQQSHAHFELVIADDGSGPETAEVIKEFQLRNRLNIIHVWQEDNGFQKTKILNKAIVASKGDYLIFTDGDCIPRADLVEKHLAMRKKDCFLSGGYFKLPMDISEEISEATIIHQDCFRPAWLFERGMNKNFKFNKLTASGSKEKFLNWITPTKATWDGNNASGWRTDILATNGFDQRMEYGGEDREFGERLMNMGVKPLQARYSLVTAHLDHARSYVKREMIEQNNRIRKETKRGKIIRTLFGIDSKSDD
jgi:glycosyltransferase involved in cell wall biosynthesis